MKEQNKYLIENDLKTIECTLTVAELTIGVSADGKFEVIYPKANNISVGNNREELVIFQDKRALFKRAPQHIKILVPDHMVPDVRVNGKVVNVNVVNGIYGDMYFDAEEGNILLSDSVFSNVEVAGENVEANIADTTVKGNLFVAIDRGNAAAENSFAKRAEFRLKHGNIGLFNLSCRDCAFDVRKGNITARLAEKEETFNTTILAREGTVNRQSAKHDGASGKLSACSGKGNITLDFVPEKERE